MVETDMEGIGTDEFERPLQFRPTWPPPPEEKPLLSFKPGFSLAFRKPNWPPPSDDEPNESSSGDLNGPSSTASGAGSTGASASQNNPSSGPRPGIGVGAVKPKRPQRDYSEFFSKNALPHHEIKFVVKPDKVHLPEVFLGDGSEEN